MTLSPSTSLLREIQAQQTCNSVTLTPASPSSSPSPSSCSDHILFNKFISTINTTTQAALADSSVERALSSCSIAQSVISHSSIAQSVISHSSKSISSEVTLSMSPHPPKFKRDFMKSSPDLASFSYREYAVNLGEIHTHTTKIVSLSAAEEETLLIPHDRPLKMISTNNSRGAVEFIEELQNGPQPYHASESLGISSTEEFNQLLTSYDAQMISLKSTEQCLQQTCEPGTGSLELKEHFMSDVAEVSCFKSYHHATWYVSNAKQTSHYFIVSFGFQPLAYRGLETGNKHFAGHVVKNGDVIFEFVSPIVSDFIDKDDFDFKLVEEMHAFIQRHGDGVKDISFEVKNVALMFRTAVSNGALAIRGPHIESDENGSALMATVQVLDDVWHTLIEQIDYSGPFLPHYTAAQGNERYGFTKAISIRGLPPVHFKSIDHCVQNEDWDKLEPACDIYQRMFGFHRFWSVDEKDVSTEYSALRSIVMASSNELIKMPMNEPAKGICKSQIEEFLDFYNGPGVQHIALLTDDIVSSVKNMRMRGTEFISTPELYYDALLPNLLAMDVKIEEDMDQLKNLGILIDFDEKGYLLQIFTKPLTDRPTFFIEIIERHNHNGFGKGNFRALFESIEHEQRLRGTLLKDTS